VSRTSEDGKTTVLASLCCETDFVARGDDFIATAEKLADYGMASAADSGAEALGQTEVSGKSLNDVITELVSKTGEKTEVGDFARYTLEGPGLISTYVHFNKKVGTMVQIETSDDSVAQSGPVKQAAADIAMHVTAAKPMALDSSGIDPKTVEREKAIFAEQVKNKPADIIGKIVEGKMKKFYAENCLLDQAFVKDDSKTVGQVIADAGKAGGGEARIKRFVRVEVG
jgi:elongation factor Ts